MAGILKRTKILIIDDHPLVREGLASRIAAHSNLEVCGEADGVTEGLAAFNATNPDMVIVDLSLKSGHGLDLIKQLTARGTTARILVMSAYDESLYAERALRAGAHGYIGKEECRENVMKAIRTVLDGRRYLSREMTDRLVGRAVGGNDAEVSSGIELLTDRELQVFELIGQGQTTREIAEQLNLSRHTIDTHREKIKTKLNLKTGAELTQQAVQRTIEKR